MVFRDWPDGFTDSLGGRGRVRTDNEDGVVRVKLGISGRQEWETGKQNIGLGV